METRLLSDLRRPASGTSRSGEAAGRWLKPRLWSGLVDCGSETVESVETVAARLRDALSVLPPERVIAAPDCGLTAHSRGWTRAKLRALGGGAAIIRKELAGAA